MARGPDHSRQLELYCTDNFLHVCWLLQHVLISALWSQLCVVLWSCKCVDCVHVSIIAGFEVGNCDIIKENYLLFVWCVLPQYKKTMFWNNNFMWQYKMQGYVCNYFYSFIFIDSYATYYKVKLLYSCPSPVKFETSLKDRNIMK
jgi:hypothetical protein